MWGLNDKKTSLIWTQLYLFANLRGEGGTWGTATKTAQSCGFSLRSGTPSASLYYCHLSNQHNVAYISMDDELFDIIFQFQPHSWSGEMQSLPFLTVLSYAVLSVLAEETLGE